MSDRSARKTVRTRVDLAINGAEPAFVAPLHVGRPVIGDTTRFHALLDQSFAEGRLTNNGPLVQELEARLAARLDVRHCITTCNGTVALQVAMHCLGLSGEIILPSFSFVATAHAVSWIGLTPVFADIDPGTHMLDPDAVSRAITQRTSAILGVHLWGRTAAVSRLQEVADRRGLSLLFDAAHAFACARDGVAVGNFGKCEVFSFHATKLFQTMEGGAITTNDDAVAERLRKARNFGFAGYDEVVDLGSNGKMSEAAAAMGLVNLAVVDDTIEANHQNHARYAAGLNGIAGLRLLHPSRAERSNWQYVVVEVDEAFSTTRDEIVRALHAENVLARRYFWPGCHRMRPYRDRPLTGDGLPHTESIAARVLVLPTGPAIGAMEISAVCEILRVLAT